MPQQRGDLLIFGMQSESGSGHTAIATSDTKMVHAHTIEGVSHDVVADVEDDPPLVFRMRDDAMLEAVAHFALLWGGRPTPFSASTKMFTKAQYKGVTVDVGEGRTFGVSEARGNEELLKFNYDALYRILKWATRDQLKPFSENRGTTCCAFATACVQTGRVSRLLSYNSLKEIFSFLAENRLAKKPKEERIGVVHKVIEKEPPANSIYIGRRSMPEFTNPGGKIDLPTALSVINEVSAKYGGTHLKSFQDLTTPALFFDAKFAVTRILLRKLREDTTHWTEVS